MVAEISIVSLKHQIIKLESEKLLGNVSKKFTYRELTMNIGRAIIFIKQLYICTDKLRFLG